MPSIEENAKKLVEGLAAGKLAYAKTDLPSPPFPPTNDYPVTMNSFLRTSLPSNYADVSDLLKHFYHPMVPQYRIPGTIPTPMQSGGAAATHAVVTAKGGSSATSKSFGSSATGGDEVGGTVFGGGSKGGQYGKFTADHIDDGLTFGKVTSLALTNSQVDPTKAGVLSFGSRMQSATPPTAFTTDATSITVYWDGTNGSTIHQVYRDDNAIGPQISGNQTITGLGSNCTSPLVCYIYQYYDESNGTINFVTNSSAIGTPAYVFTAQNILALQQQFLRNRLPLSTTLTTTGFSTPASGTGSGSGGGGGGGGGGYVDKRLK